MGYGTLQHPMLQHHDITAAHATGYGSRHNHAAQELFEQYTEKKDRHKDIVRLCEELDEERLELEDTIYELKQELWDMGYDV